jgi:hypothetical protein
VTSRTSVAAACALRLCHLRGEDSGDGSLCSFVSAFVVRRVSDSAQSLVRSPPAPDTDVNLRFCTGLILLGPQDCSQLISFAV